MPSHQSTNSKSTKNARWKHALVGAGIGFLAPFFIQTAINIGGTARVTLVDLAVGLLVGAAIGFYFGKRILGYDSDNLDRDASIKRARNLGRIAWSACFIVISLMLLSGIFVVRIGINEAWTAWNTQSWPNAVGVIVVSKVKAVSSIQETQITGADTTETRATRVVDDYFPIVQYEYEADGKQWTGDKIYSTVVSSSSSANAQSIADRFPVGSEVKVYFNADDPSQAVLIPGLHFGGLSALIIGSIWSLASIVIGWLLLFSPFAGFWNKLI